MAKVRTAVVAAAAGLAIAAVGFATPASASWQGASGYHVCPAGQTLRLTVYTSTNSTVDFSLNGRFRFADPIGHTHVYDYQVRGGTWSVQTPGVLSSVGEGCSAATLLR